MRDRGAAGHQGRARPHRRRRVGHRQHAPQHLHAAVDASLQRLGVEQIALWQHHRPDPDVDYADVIGTLAEIHASGKVRDDRAVQRRPRPDPAGPRRCSATRWSACRTSSRRPSAAAAPRSTSAPSSAWPSCRGARSVGSPTPRSWPTSTRPSPRSPRPRGVSAQQVALAWELAQSPVVIPIPGAKRPQSITDSAAAADLELTADELARLDAADPGTSQEPAMARPILARAGRRGRWTARWSSATRRSASGGTARRCRLAGSTRCPRSLEGRHVLVTGASSGLGIATRRGSGRSSVRPCTCSVRRRGQGCGVARPDRAAQPGARLRLWRCDVADLDDVRRFAAGLAAEVPTSTRSCTTRASMPPERTESAAGPSSSAWPCTCVGPVVMTEALRRAAGRRPGGAGEQRRAVRPAAATRTTRASRAGDYSPTAAVRPVEAAGRSSSPPLLADRWSVSTGSPRSRPCTRAGRTPRACGSRSPTLPCRLTRPVLRDDAQGADTSVWLVGRASRRRRPAASGTTGSSARPTCCRRRAGATATGPVPGPGCARRPGWTTPPHPRVARC